MNQISKFQAYELIKNSNGKFFTVTFVTKEGTTRVMNARLGVKKGLTGEGLKYNPALKNLQTVFDVVKKEYRMINLETMSVLTIQGQTYEIV